MKLIGMRQFRAPGRTSTTGCAEAHWRRASARPSAAAIRHEPVSRLRSRALSARAQPRAQPAGEDGVSAVEDGGDDQERDAEQRELRSGRAGRVDELREERGVEEQRLWVGRRHQYALPEQSARAHRAAVEIVQPQRRRPPLLDAQPEQIGHAGPAQPLEPRRERQDQRGHADRHDHQLQRDRRAGAGERDQRAPGPVRQAVGDQEGDVGPRDQDQHGRGQEEGEVQIGVHRRALRS